MYAFAPLHDCASPPSPLSFDFADSLPAQSWQPPSPAVLYDLATEASSQHGFVLEPMETAWAATERMGL